MARCEDYPCCGHTLGECPNYEITRKCKDCGVSFHPDSMTWNYCYSCGQKPVKTGPRREELPPALANESCEDCLNREEKRARRPNYGSLENMAEAVPKADELWNGTPLCHECAEEATCEFMNSQEERDFD